MRPRLPVLLLLPALWLAAPLHGQGAEPARTPARPLFGASAGIPSYAHQQGWFSRDKLYHFGISAVGAGGLYAGGRRLGLSRRQAALASTLVMGAAGVWREVGTTDRADPLTRRKLSRKDLVWDAAGIVLGLAVADRWT
ncbi:MAG TPA: hypothetical protein VGV85_00150, partial [Longimicrobiaceae bacterium]|nr:hypothetical protein [Longimicrobiaceae bacterium]